ncbi:MAG: cyclic nucleotide-binding domain-containing protein [Deltaproteobacteria bacterium]|nr:cyclic nucleotide-binding domain-containing protein [Deltaproteobacteria bacterium]
MNRTEIQEVLTTCEFFKDFEKMDLDKIAALCRIDTFDPGDVIFRQGEFGDHVYIIADGHVFLERSMDLGTRKGNVVIGILGKGRVLGCWSTLLGEPHNLMSSASCQKPTKLVAIRGADLRDMMINNLEVGFQVLERLCFLLRDRIQGAIGAMEKI